MRKRGWWLLGLALLPLLAYGGLIGEAYARPKLVIHGGTTTTPTVRIGLELENVGFRPLMLVGAGVAGIPGVTSSAWTSLAQPGANGNWLAGNMSVAPEADRSNHPYRSGPVEGWSLAPSCRPCLQDLYGLRLDIPSGTHPGKYELTVRYRYLGWPFTVHEQIEVPEP